MASLRWRLRVGPQSYLCSDPLDMMPYNIIFWQMIGYGRETILPGYLDRNTDTALSDVTWDYDTWA